MDDKKSNLSKTAKEVNPHLKRAYEEMRKEKIANNANEEETNINDQPL